MAKSPQELSSGNEAEMEIDLRDPRLAAFLAWLVPGLGHIYQRRTGKGILFFVCIVGTFVYGVYIGGGRVTYASTAPVLSRNFEFVQRWQYICQLGVGLPALPALVQRERMQDGKPPMDFPIVGQDFMRPPYDNPPPGMPGGFTSKDRYNNVVHHPDELAKWQYDLGEYFEIGTVFTVIAGLLNVLAIFDAYGGPLILASDEEKTAGDKQDEKSKEGAS